MRASLAVLLMLAAPAVAAAQSAMHPPVPLRDAEGRNVLESGGPVSPVQSCGGCHHTRYITSHSTHGGELNCLLCHTPQPAGAQLDSARSPWAATAALAHTELVARTASGWRWNPEAFDPEGLARQDVLEIQDPKTTNCGLCHGLAAQSASAAGLVDTPEANPTGEVFSAQRITVSAVNVAGKQRLGRPWDVHAERLLECTDCHHSVNNPAFAASPAARAAGHLRFDARRLEIDQYLRQPSHRLAKGYRAQPGPADHLDGSIRSCGDCHDAASAHAWLPYPVRHMRALSCEACHVPHVPAAAPAQVDWTMLTPEGSPRVEYRGVEGDPADPTSLVEGYRPVLLPRRLPDGSSKLVPHNLVATWTWVAGESAVPIEREVLQAALLQAGRYHPDVVAALDANRDGVLRAAELRLDSTEKIGAIRHRFEVLGIPDARIRGELVPYGVHHGVVRGRFATRECNECHAADSRVAESVELAAYLPGGVVPEPIAGTNVSLAGAVEATPEGRLVFHPSTRAAEVYLVGHDRSRWLDWLGGLFVLSVLGTVSVHTVLRVRVPLRKGRSRP